MRKKIAGRKFKRTINQRKALFRGLITSMILNEQIRTTEAKAKSIKADVEKIITIGRKNASNAEIELYKKIPNKEAVEKVMKTLGPLFANRPGGYTRIVRLESRLKDNAKMVLLQFVEKAEIGEVVAVSKKKDNKKSAKKSAPKKESVAKTQMKTAKASPLKAIKNIATKSQRTSKRGDK
jgi:large subunit ribosomal protein L17